MQTSEHYYLFTLQEALQARQRKNPNYSLRAFAKDLEMDSSNLSAILAKKRGLPNKRAPQIAKKLRLSPIETSLFIASTQQKQTRLETIKTKKEMKRYLLDEKYYKIISEWEYYAVLQLIDTDDFVSRVDWIADRLGVSSSRASTIVQHLEELGFIKLDKKRGYIRTSPSLETSEDIESQALQKSHIEALELGLEKLEKVPVDKRDYSSITIAVDATKIPEAKALIREFQEKLYALLSSDNKNEVYQFNCQLFPLTKESKNK